VKGAQAAARTGRHCQACPCSWCTAYRLALRGPEQQLQGRKPQTIAGQCMWVVWCIMCVGIGPNMHGTCRCLTQLLTIHAATARDCQITLWPVLNAVGAASTATCKHYLSTTSLHLADHPLPHIKGGAAEGVHQGFCAGGSKCFPMAVKRE
jgi:hypothetical protein